jgi:signal transduction histidine kinase
MTRRLELERLFLWHLWACLPFVFVWVMWPRIFGHNDPPSRIALLRLVYLAAVAYLSVRTYLTLRPWGKVPWSYVWPVADVLLISAGLAAHHTEAGSWAILLYLFPLTQAAATLQLRWALLVAGLCAGCYLLVCGAGDVATSAGAFRPFFLVLMASLVTRLGLELARAQEDLALGQYRDQLSAEMHDGLQQYLVSIAARLEIARGMMASSPRQAAEFAVDQRHLVRQAADELRAMIRRLRSPLLEQEGLTEALRQHVNLFRERSGAHAELVVTGQQERLDARIEHALLRIVQEALTNIVKHARATRITVSLDFHPDHVVCSVTDDGVGFEAQAPSAGGADLSGLGLSTMQSRAALVDGTCEVQSRPGGGSTVTITVPLEPAQPEREPRQPSQLPQP